MRRKILALLCVFGIAASSITANAQEAGTYAASSTYTYSIGGVNAEGDDFTPNVNYSSTIFGMMGSVTNAYKSTSPNIDYLKGNNPSGYKRLGSKIVLLTGHANASQILLDGGGNMVGVNKTDSFTADSGRKYVGLDTISMSNTDLIMFFGCNTASEDSNLCTASIGRGAKVAVGTSDKVVSRTGEGATWVQRFLDGLYNGKSVVSAGTYANNFVSSTNSMRTSWTYEGKGGTIVNPSTRSASADVNSEFALDESIIEKTVQIELSNFVDAVVSEKATDYSDILTDVVSYLGTIDDSFDLADYTISTKAFGDDQGILSLEYRIGDDIATEKGFTFVYDNGKLVSVTYDADLYGTTKQRNLSVDEEKLISIVDQHKANTPAMVLTEDQSEYSYYTFDYNSQQLKYVTEEYIFDGEVWKGNIVEEQLN